MSQEHVDFLIEQLGVNNGLTLQQMKDMLEDQFQLAVTITTVYRALSGVCYSLKKLHRDSEYRNTPTNKEKRKNIAVNLLNYMFAEKKVCYPDETNFNLWYSRSQGRIRSGTRAIQQNVASKGRNIHDMHFK